MLGSHEVIEAADALLAAQDPSTYTFSMTHNGGVNVEEWDVGIANNNVYKRVTTTPLSLWVDMLTHYSEHEIGWHEVKAISSTIMARMFEDGDSNG